VSKQRIKLLITDDSLPIGGKENLLLNYLQNIDRRKFFVHLITLTPNGEYIEEARKHSDNYYCVQRQTGFDLKAIWRLRQYLKKKKIKVIHTNQWIDSLYVFIASIKLRLTKISTIHGYISGWRLWIHRFILRRFDKVICVTYSSLEEIINRGYSSHNLVVVYNGITADHFKNENIFSPNKKSIVIGMVGSFRRERDHLTILKAINQLVKSGKKDIEVCFIGGVLDPECKTEIMKYSSENGLDRYVRYLGTRRDISDQLSRLDIYVASSHTETFGIALVEAMACGLPVIVSDIPAFMEIIEIGKYGLYFEKGNHKELARKIEFLMENKSEMSHYAELSFERSAEFSIDSSIKRLEETYQRELLKY